MKYLFCLLAVCSMLSCSKKNSSSPNVTPQNIIVPFIVNDSADQSKTLQNEIDSCSAVGGGIVEVATPGTYFIGPIQMRSNVNLQLDTMVTLMGMGNINAGAITLITGVNLTNIAITGKGVIDGNGAPWWAAYRTNGISRPDLVYFTSCVGVTLSGITLQNSPEFHFVPKTCTYVSVNNVTVLAPSNSPNTDGIDPINSTNVSITNCYISNGDDCIAIKADVESPIKYTNSVTVTGCTFGTGHGLSVGSNVDGVENVYVSNCTFNGTTNGIRIKSNLGLGGPMANLNYSNITMTNVQNPILVTFEYTSNGVGTTFTDVPTLNGLTITNLTATGCANAGSLSGSETGLTTQLTTYLQNVTLTNLNITANTGMSISNAQGVTLTNCVIHVSSGDSLTTTNVLP